MIRTGCYPIQIFKHDVRTNENGKPRDMDVCFRQNKCIPSCLFRDYVLLLHRAWIHKQRRQTGWQLPSKVFGHRSVTSASCIAVNRHLCEDSLCSSKAPCPRPKASKSEGPRRADERDSGRIVAGGWQVCYSGSRLISGRVAELADALDLGSSGVIRGGSSPLSPIDCVSAERRFSFWGS